MILIAKHFLYILLIVACTSLATLYISKGTNKSGRIYRTISTFTVCIVIYMIIEMFLASTYISLISPNARYVFIILSDAAFFSILLSWVRILSITTKEHAIIDWRRMVVYTVVYAVFVEALAMALRCGLVEAYAEELAVVILICDICYDCLAMVVSAVFLKFTLRQPKDEPSRIFSIGLSVLLILYMIYVLSWDIRIGVVDKGSFSIYQEFDPILIFYTLACILIVKFARDNEGEAITQDFYRVIGISTDEIEMWSNMAEKYKLTVREVEVAQQVFRGKSNTDIAEALFISESTVKQHTRSIFKKTGTQNRYEFISMMK